MSDNVNQEILKLIAAAQSNLDTAIRLVSGEHESNNWDPDDPRNKDGVNLTPRGVELVYRMFDNGQTRYAVKEALGISFGAANYRYEKWQELGANDRTKPEDSKL